MTDAPPPDATVLAYGRPPRPCCDRHRVEMVPYSRGDGGPVRYWRCPVPGCRETGQDLRKYALKRRL